MPYLLATLPSTCPQSGLPEAAPFSYLIIPGDPQQGSTSFVSNPSPHDHTAISAASATCPLSSTPHRGLDSSTDPGLTDQVPKLTLISSWRWWFSRSCTHCSLGGGKREKTVVGLGPVPFCPLVHPTYPGPH